MKHPYGPPLSPDRPSITARPGEKLKRKHFSQKKLDELRLKGDSWIIPHEERDASRRKIMERIIPGDDIWVFAYGSLMWNPIIRVEETCKARIYGYHRSFCLWLISGRGTPDYPGLMLALDYGGSCAGLVHRVHGSRVEAELDLLWMREMIGGHYVPIWTNTHTPRGILPSIAFVIDRTHRQYAGKLNKTQIARRIAIAEGRMGTNRSYLFDTVRQLDALGVSDGPIHELEQLVRSASDEPE